MFSYGQIISQSSVFTIKFEHFLARKLFLKRYVPEQSYVNAPDP